jgi:hypothetical protein
VTDHVTLAEVFDFDYCLRHQFLTTDYTEDTDKKEIRVLRSFQWVKIGPIPLFGASDSSGK